jgi:hypothetical protein
MTMSLDFRYPSGSFHTIPPKSSDHVNITLPTTETSLTAQSALTELLCQTKLIIWDEAPAQYRYYFEAIDRTLRDIRKNDTWFGGITMVFAGIYPHERNH